ncbi:unnamed protein product [Caenorhabditis brenneri]
MKLLKLPFLCQKEVFNEMHFSTRYTFTFGTRRMKIWAKRLQNSSGSAELQVEIGNVGVNVAFLVKSDDRVEKILDLARRELDPDETRVMKFSDLELECEISFSPNILLKYDNPLPPTTRILDSLCDFFNTTKEDIVYILNRLFTLHHLPPIPIQKSLLRLGYWRRNFEYMDQFYSSYPVQHFSMISAEDDFLGVVPDDFHMLRTRNLILSNIGRVNISVLTGFQGENAVFSGGFIETSTIHDFLENWMNRDADELKTIIVEVTDPIQDNDIFARIPHIKEEESVRYPYNSIIQDYYDFPEDAFDCTNTYNITRHAGSPWEKKGTVKLTSNFFMFLVWD